ncbi:MAG TPA: FkbM family methyltransferase [Crocinitomix sp.]|nr:FkbM family methyltransferase [Crocinitomix sp.]
MKIIRKLLVKIVGIKTYLTWVSKIYITLIKLGFSKKKYSELYFIQTLVKSGDTVLDIGANLGYYSYFFAKKIGKQGQLLAIEPIPLFAKIWKKNLKKYSNYNLKLFNCALGSESKNKVKMSIPIVDGVVRHGLTKVEGQGDENWESLIDYEVPMQVGDELIEKENLTALNYIKCDVEGYEHYVIPSLKQTILKFKPLIQIELNGKENRQTVADFLFDLKYEVYILEKNKLNKITPNQIHNYNQDFYFIPQKK